MKKVAGRIKLELSQYRDLEAFAQFGSDLDADTQRTLARGERLVMTLNQHEREPLPVEDQVIQIYAATNGYLDRINVERVTEFLMELTERAHAQLERGAGEDRRRGLVGGDAEGGPRCRRVLRGGLRLRPRRGGPAAGGGDGDRLARALEPAGSSLPCLTARRQEQDRRGKNMQKITRAMEMVAAARLRRAEQRIEALRPYADALRRMTRQAAAGRRRRGGARAAAAGARARAARGRAADHR